MTRAVVLCGGDAAGIGDAERVAILRRLCGQLSHLGISDVILLARPGWAGDLRAAGLAAVASTDHADDLATIANLAATCAEPLVLCEGDLVAHVNALAEAVADGIRATTALVGARRRLDLHAPVLRQRSRIISVGSMYHQVSAANCALRGVVKVPFADLPALQVACAELSSLATQTGQSLEAIAGPSGLVGLIVLALTRAGTPVAGYRVRLLTAGRVADQATLERARTELAAVDENEVALRLAVKEHDDLFATYCVSTYSPRVVRWAARLGLTPTVVTWISIFFAAAAAGCFGFGRRDLALAGGALLYVGFLFDCVDGQLARYTHRYSRFGGWLDVIADRAKEYLVYAGLAVGAGRRGQDVWILAIGAMVLQTARHMTDTWYGALQDEAVSWLPKVPLLRPTDRLQDTDTNGRRLSKRLGGLLGRASARLESNRASFGYWVKRTVVFPIGERWVVIIVVTAVFGPRAALVALLAWGGAALAYTVSGRTLRARAMRIAPMPARGIPLHRDDGALAHRLGAVGRGRPRPLLLSLVGLFVGAALVALAGLDVSTTADLSQEWVVLAVAGVLLVAALAGRNPHDRPLDWLVPAALRAAESMFVVIVGINDEVPAPLIMALLGLIALYNYDLAARLDKGASPLRRRWLNLGWDGRVVILAVAAAFDLSVPAVGILLGYLALAFVVDALGGVAARPAEHETVPARVPAHAASAAQVRP